MSDATDDLETFEYFGTYTPVRDMDGIWYTYWHEGEKYKFRTVEEANKWAKGKGFKLAPKPRNTEGGAMSNDKALEELRERIFKDGTITFEPYTAEDMKTEHIVTINLNHLMKLITNYSNERDKLVRIDGAVEATEAYLIELKKQQADLNQKEPSDV